MARIDDTMKQRAASIAIMAVGAVLLAEGVLKWVSGTSIFLPWLYFVHEFVIGFMVIILGEMLLVRKAC
jgi:hypothetical protein